MGKISKKMLAVWMSALLLLPVNAATAEETIPFLTVESCQAEKGTVFSLPVSIVQNSGLMGFDIQVLYDAEYLEPIEVQAGKLLEDGIVDDSIAVSTGESFHVIWAGSENMSSDGEILQIWFLMKQSAPDDITEIQLVSAQDNTYNEQYQTIALGSGKALITPTKVNGVKKKSLDGLSVFVEGWVSGDSASVPVLTGNSGNGKVSYTYSDQVDGIYTEEIPVKPGRYYLKASVSETDDYFGGVASCTFEIAESPAPSGTAKPVESPGQGIVPGDGIGNQSEQKQTIDKLSVPKIKSIRNQKGRKVQITLSKKFKNISGYEIQYAAKKNFKNANVVSGKRTKKAFTIKGLKKNKKYYVRIRAYRSKGSVIYYSKWSSRRQIKIKK